MAELKRQLEEQTEELAGLAGDHTKLTKANQIHATELEVVQSELEKAVKELQSMTAKMKLPLDKFEANGAGAKTKEILEAELERVKKELGKKNIEFAGLKVT